jgi:kinesin family protein 11
MTCKTLCDKVASASSQQVTALREAILTLYSLLDTAVLDVQEFLKEERQALRAMKDLAETSTHENVSHLKQQNEILAQMLVNERKDAETAKSDLIQRVSGLLGEFMQKRDESLRGSVESLQNSNVEAKALLISTLGRQVDIHQNAMQRNTNLDSGLGRSGAKAEEAREDAADVREQLVISSQLNLFISFYRLRIRHLRSLNLEMKKSRTLFPCPLQHIRLGYRSEHNKWRIPAQVVRCQ